MKRSVLINGFKFILLLLAIGISIILWVNRQLKTANGGFTELLDVHEIVNTYSKIVIKNVNILSPNCEQFIPNQNVVLQDGIIQSINKDTIFDNIFTVIQGENRYLIPGLVDSHIHIS